MPQFQHILELAGRLISAISQRLSEARRRQFLKAHFRHMTRLAEAMDDADMDVTAPVPFISFVVPVYNGRPNHLKDLLRSFINQRGPHCELVLSDDGSTSPETCRWLMAQESRSDIVILRSLKNHGIAHATNRGIMASSGEWIGLVDQDDALASNAVVRVAHAIRSRPGTKFIYTDELVVDEKLRPKDYFFKPAWDAVLLSGENYVNHLSLYRRDLLLEIGCLREGFDGSQDYDLVLRYTRRLLEQEIVHLPYAAYLWRVHEDSFSHRSREKATVSARKALTEAYGDGRALDVEPALQRDLHRIRFDRTISEWPLVSVVIPNRDSLPLIHEVLDGLVHRTDYPRLEIIVIDNGTTDTQVLALYRDYAAGEVPFRAEVAAEAFNFSRAINKGIALATGKYVLFLNNDIEILKVDWLKEMVCCFSYQNVGIVGAKLIYPNNTLQHAGVIAGLGGLAGHWFVGEAENIPGPMGRFWVRQSLSAVTGACMLVSRACLQELGSLDAVEFPIAYNDVDFCLRALHASYRVVWTPFAKLVHHESASRGSDETPANAVRFNREKEALRRRHGTDTCEDRAYNPWYSRHSSMPRPVKLDRLPDPR